jgi:hypothetical protein
MSVQTYKYIMTKLYVKLVYSQQQWMILVNGAVHSMILNSYCHHSHRLNCFLIELREKVSKNV